MRLYDKNNKPRGSINFYENKQGINLQFSRNSKYFLSFRKMVNEFLNRENLKIVSSEGSSRTHKNHKKYSKRIDGFDVFIKWRNPRTQKIKNVKRNISKSKRRRTWQPIADLSNFA